MTQGTPHFAVCPVRYSIISSHFVAELLHPTELSSSMESLAAYDASVGSPGPVHQSQRTKRMRTSFKHHQLRTMKNYFAINQNPDAKDLKQLAQKTGLSKRVLQVGHKFHLRFPPPPPRIGCVLPFTIPARECFDFVLK